MRNYVSRNFVSPREMFRDDLPTTMLFAGMIVAGIVGPDWMRLAGFGLVASFWTSVGVVAIVRRLRGDHAADVVFSRLRSYVRLFFYTWVPFCAYLGTHSWIWTLVAFAATIVIRLLLTLLSPMRKQTRRGATARAIRPKLRRAPRVR